MKFLLRIAVVVGLAGLSGCVQTYRFKVDALAAPQAVSSTTFAFEAPAADVRGSQLRYLEATDYVGRALRSRGWTQVEQPGAADILISLVAEVSGPLNESQTWSEPVYYRTWPRSRIIRTPVRSRDGEVRYVATRIYLPPQTYFAGYQSYDRNIIVYEKSLDLTARNRSGEEVWTISVETVDTSSDLRSYIPLLAAAALPYVGETTDGSVVVRVKEDDEAVQFLRGVAPGTAG